MKADNFSRAAHKLAEALAAKLPVINEKMALNGAAMVKDRILNTGKNAQGKDLGKYSDNALPAFFFKDKALNKSGEKFYEKSKKDGKGISYKAWREANNRPTDHVTLSFSGTTLKDISVTKQITDGAKVITSIGPKNTKTRDNGDTTEKIVDEYLGPRYGNFLAPNKEEQEKLQKILSTSVQKIIQDAFQ